MECVAIDARLIGARSTGDSTYWLGLLHGLSRIDSGLKILLYSNAPRPAEIPIDGDFSWVTIPGHRRIWSLLHFPLHARRSGAGVIHTQYNLSPLAGKRGVTTIHDVSFFVEPSWFPARPRAILQRFVPGSASRAARVITVSETSRSEIERYIPAARGKTSVTPLARNVLITPVQRETAQRVVAERFQLEQPYLLTVGTRWPRKNMALAVSASDLLPDDLPHRLVLTGKAGWGEDHVGKRTVTPGYVSEAELSALYSAADLYIAPSFHEGFGLPLLEAFGCGCPVLCSSGGAFPEVAGDAAHVMRSWQPEDWAATMGDLLRDPSKLDDLRRRGYEREREFSWERTATLTAEVYKDVIHDRP
jgi:glycosyltransferase involved in cell wall biosynthesis